MSDSLEIRDPIHGFIYRSPEERDIIDTKVFQRLRRLKQLAMASHVYPGATHSRFEHCLGAFHLAGKLVKRLCPIETNQKLVRLAALLHDVGHGPFSHVAEPILKKHTPPKNLALVATESKIHELISWNIIKKDVELSKLIADKQREQIIGLLNGTWGDSYLQEIVSGPVDVDKQDYLLRDSHFSGVKYGIYDQERLSNTLLVHEGSDDNFLAVSIDGIHALEQFVLAKYYMTTQVYRHRIRLITDQMIARAIDLGIERDNISWLKDLYTYDGSDEYIKEYLTWSDDRVISEVLDKRTPAGYAKELFSMLQDRELFKCIFEADPNDFPDPNVRNFVFGGDDKFYRPLEKSIASQFEFDPNYVITYMVKFDSAARTESEIPVLHPTKTTLFHDESALFNSVDQKIREQKFHVYAPAKYHDDKDKKKKIREFKNEILRLIDDLANPQRALQ